MEIGFSIHFEIFTQIYFHTSATNAYRLISIGQFINKKKKKTPIETLGIVITDNEDKNYKYNFQNKIENLKPTLNIWKQR